MESSQSGPTTIIRYICNGCQFFKAEWWKDYLDNDETDCGYATSCKHTIVGRPIRSYGSNIEEPTPAWCPFLSNYELVD